MHFSFSAALSQYMDHLQASGLKPNTIKNRTQVLRKATIVWGNKPVKRLNASDMDALLAAYDWSPRTRNLYISNLRLFFRWMRRVRMVPRDFDPTVNLSNVRVPRTSRMRVPVEQFPALLDAAKHPRDRAVVALGLFLFLRGSELRTLQIQDVNFTDATVHIYRHKTQDEDTLPMCQELQEELSKYLSWYRQDQGDLQPNWFLVPAKFSQKFTWVDGQRVLLDGPTPLRPERPMSHPYRPAKRALDALDLDAPGEGEHTLRRSGARAWFNTLRAEGHSGALMRVSSMLGHSDTRITEHYIGVDSERVERNNILSGNRMFPTNVRDTDEGDSSQGLRLVT